MFQQALLAQAEQTDEAEDARYGKGQRGDQLPEERARRESRLKKLQQAKAELEQEARDKAILIFRFADTDAAIASLQAAGVKLMTARNG